MAACGLAAPHLWGQEAPPPTPPTPPATPATPPTPTKRVLKTFPFDEPNPERLPLEWRGTVLNADGSARAGFPRFNLAEIDRGRGFSGARSLKLPTQGGGIAVRLEAGEVAVFADADYSIAAMVRTEALEHARAFVSARLLDQRNQPIAGTEVRSEPVLSQGAWRPITIHVAGGHPSAAWLQIDLEVLQPKQFAAAAADEPASRALQQHRVWREDVRGAAWFDDISILQVPRAGLTTTSSRNIVMSPEAPELSMSVRDLGGDPLWGRVLVYDIDGRIVARQTTALDPGGHPLLWKPKLPGYGWYRSTMNVMTGEPETGGEQPPISSATTQFIWLPPDDQDLPGNGTDAQSEEAERAARALATAASRFDASRFGIIAERTPDARIDDLPELVRRMGTGFIHLAAWDEQSSAEGAAESLKVRRPALESLLRAGQSVTLSLDGIPSPLARATLLPADDSLSLATIDSRQWLPLLAPMLDVFGQRVLRYQFGGLGDDHAFWKKDLGTPIALMESALATLVPGPVISVPWNADRVAPAALRPTPAELAAAAAAAAAQSAPAPAGEPASTDPVRRTLATPLQAMPQAGRLIDGLTLLYPASFPPSALRDLPGQYLTGKNAPELTVVMELPNPEIYGGRAAVIDLARRAIEFWGGLADAPAPSTDSTAARLALAQPWSWDQSQPPQVLPRPEAAAFVNLRERLAGRRIVGELTSTPGVKCYILASRNATLGTLDRGALVAWNEAAEPSKAAVDAASIGTSLWIYDIFGNRTEIPARESDGSSVSPLVSVPVGEAPVFIEGIDAYLALFASSFRLEPGFMPAVVREHEHHILLTNPWPVRITGKLQLKEDSTRQPGRVVTDEWQVSPSGIVDFDMAPGQTLSVPVALSFGPGQLAGVKDFVIVARAIADRAYPPVRLKAAVEVGLEDVDLSPEVQLGSGGDVIVIAAITNKGQHTRTLRVETAARNMPSQQLQISDLPPGQTVLRRFVFRGAASSLSGRRVVISVSDLEEAERLNKAVLVP